TIFMSASRIFKYELHNDVHGHTLILQQEHLCGGCYTPDWEPPSEIDFGQSKGMQAESCGIMTGTQGWVKYRIIRNSDQAMRGIVYLYWTNPYFGVTFGRHALASLRWTANCDEDPPAAGSGFSTSDESPPFGFHLSLEGTYRNGSPTVIDGLGDVYRIPLAPVFVFGTGGIWERMDVVMKLSSEEVQSVFPGPVPRTLSLETKPRRVIIEGEWVGKDVDVIIRHIWAGQYEVIVTDTTRGLPINLTAVCSFGISGLARMFAGDHIIESMVTTEIVGTTHLDIGKATVALSAVSSVLRNIGELNVTGLSSLGLSKAKEKDIASATIKKNVLELGVIHSPVLDVLADSAAEHAKM